MDNHRDGHTLKRRRPYIQEGTPSEPVFQGHPSLAPPDVDAPSLTEDGRRYILEQAASILSVSVPQLLQVSRTSEQTTILERAALALEVPVTSLIELSEHHNQQRPKRPRLDATVAMPTVFSTSSEPQGSLEKRLDSEHPGREAHSGPPRPFPTASEGGMLLGLSTSPIADCLGSLAVCNPCSYLESQAEEYQPLTATARSDYGTGRVVGFEPTATATSPMVQVPGPEYHVTVTTSSETSGCILSSEAPSVMTGYVQQYPPPMHPLKVITGVQPAVNRDAMFYPANPTSAPYPKPIPAGQELALVQPNPDAGVIEDLGNSYAGNEGTLEAPSPSPSSSQTGAAWDLTPGYGMYAGYGPGSNLAPGYGTYAGYGPASNLSDNGSGTNMELYPRVADAGMSFPTHRAPPAKRGPFKDHAERQKTAYTRKIGSCIRCRMQRIRCHTDPDDDKGPCGTCKKVANTNKIWRLPCLRLKISDIKLSKIGQVKGHEWTRRWKDSMVTDDISNWAPGETKTIKVTEGFTDKPVELRVRQFIPQEGDSLSRSWVIDGVKRSVDIPPYALVDMDQAKADYEAYIRTGVIQCCKHILGTKEKLLWQTYALAIKLSQDKSLDRRERQLLCSTLELWMSIRLTTTSFEIVGDETLGMQPNIMDESSTLSGKIPLPPVMGFQLDSILIHQIQAKFRHDTLDLLQKMTQENKQKTWVTTYLVTFILLHNIALVIKHDAGYALKHGMPRRFARPEKVKEIYLGAITLLAYFHYRGGSKVFAPEFKDDDLRLHSSEEAVQFISQTRRYAEEHEKVWQELVSGPNVENEFYFIAQLFETNWSPRSWSGDEPA